MAEQQSNSQFNNGKKPVDANRLGSNYQKQAQQTAKEMDLTKPNTKAHDPHPERSSKRAAVKTYKDYAAESLRKGGGSLTKMILAEREKERDQNRKSPTNPKNLALGTLATIFVILGIGLVGGTYYLVNFVQNDVARKNGIIVTPNPLVLFDYRAEENISTPTRSRLISASEDQIAETTIEAGALKYIYFTESVGGERSLVTAPGFMEYLRAKAPATLYRTMRDNFMYGIYSTTENSPFLMFKVDSFEVAFADMIAWEQQLGQDMGAFLGRDNFNFSQTQFVDRDLYNRDTRLVLDQQGEIVLGYAFIDRNTLVLFNNKLALRELIQRSQRNTVKQ